MYPCFQGNISDVRIPAFPFDLPMQSGTCNSCNMAMRDLPDMYA